MKGRVFLACLLVLALAVVWLGCRDSTKPVIGPTESDFDPALARGGVDKGGGGIIKTSLRINSHVEATTTAEGCTNNPGPFITLSGELTLGGLNGRLIFKNNVKGTHTNTEDAIIDVVILDEGEVIRFNKQPPHGGVGGNPHISIQFLDGRGRPISKENYLGRCVQGLRTTNLDFGMLTEAEAKVTSGGCDNSGGPFLTLTGELRLGGINARLIFRNNAKGTHERIEQVEVDVVIVPAGETIRFAKQPPQGGAGGNPLIFFQFTDSSGNAMSKEIYLGRCVQLGK
jgi:hypothetical protein